MSTPRSTTASPQDPSIAASSAELDDFSNLLAGLYRTPLQEGPSEAVWRPWLDQLRAQFHCNYTVLVLRPPSEVDAGINLASGPSYSPNNDYNARHYSIDPFVNLPPGQVVTLTEYVSEARLLASEFYKVCLQPADTFHILGVDLPVISGLRTGLRLCRPRTGQDYTPAERAAVARLVPHLQQAIELYHRVNHMDLELSLYAGALTQLSVATLLLDSELHIFGANPVAERLLGEQDGLRRVDDVLHLVRRRDQQQLRDLIAQSVEARRNQAPTLAGAMPVERPSGRAPLALVVRPLPETSTESHDGPTVSVFISDPEHPPEVSADVLCQLFSLTRAEARLALLLANGLNLDQATTELGITRNTGRAHLRSIFTKTGVSQQTQLVSLILKSAASLS